MLPEIDNLDKNKLKILIVTKLWIFFHVHNVSCYMVGNGDYLSIGYPAKDQGDNLLSVSKYVNSDEIKKLRKELDLHNLKEFEVCLYVGPTINSNTKVIKENKDKIE